MSKGKDVNHLRYVKRVFDLPEVVIRDGDISRAIKALRVRVVHYGTFSVLKHRRDHASVSARRRAKRRRVLRRINRKKIKE